MVAKHKSKKNYVKQKFHSKKFKGNITKFNQIKYTDCATHEENQNNADLNNTAGPSLNNTACPSVQKANVDDNECATHEENQNNADLNNTAGPSLNNTACPSVQNTTVDDNEQRDEGEASEDYSSPEKRHIIKGIRLINFEYFWRLLIPIVMHNSFCNIECLEVYGEKEYGLNSLLRIQCKMCKKKFKIYTCENPFPNTKKDKSNTDKEYEPPTKLLGGINFHAVLGITNIGSGYYHLKEFLSCLNIPCLSSNAFSTHQKKLLLNWTTSAEKTMRASVAEEVTLARERGDVTACWRKIPLLTIIIDGCWAKRSYKVNFSSLSGAVTFVGAYTKKILWIGK
jgi:hypothetical protein